MREPWMDSFKIEYVNSLLGGDHHPEWIRRAFTWSRTPEGSKYWDNLYVRRRIDPQAYAILWNMKKKYKEVCGG